MKKNNFSALVLFAPFWLLVSSCQTFEEILKSETGFGKIGVAIVLVLLILVFLRAGKKK